MKVTLLPPSMLPSLLSKQHEFLWTVVRLVNELCILGRRNFILVV